LARAYEGSQRIARFGDQGAVEEYQKLVATGLSCMDAAIQTAKLPPRTEALARLRYAAVVIEETENKTEAETTLTKAIALCKKVRWSQVLAQFIY